MRRLLYVAALLMIAALVLAPAALADKPVQDLNCTFEKGETTCITTEESFYTTSAWVYSTWVYCGAYFTSERHNPQFKMFYQDWRTDITKTTTTVYRGKSNTILSSDTVTSESQPYKVGEPYPKDCINPGKNY